MPTVGEHSTLAEIDLTDLDRFNTGFPHDVFEVHRREAPVWWHEPTEHTPDPAFDEPTGDGGSRLQAARTTMSTAVERSASLIAEKRLIEPAEWTRSNRHTGMRHLVEFNPI